MPIGTPAPLLLGPQGEEGRRRGRGELGRAGVGRADLTTAKRPELVVAHDLASNLRRLSDESPFARTGQGRFTLRELAREVYEAKPQKRGGWKWR